MRMKTAIYSYDFISDFCELMEFLWVLRASNTTFIRREKITCPITEILANRNVFRHLREAYAIVMSTEIQT